MSEALLFLPDALDFTGARGSRWTPPRQRASMRSMQRTSSTPRKLHLVRTHATSANQRPAGDEQVRRALTLMHGQLHARWTVSLLARRVGLSRPLFARRFVESTGVTPMRYLTARRMERAAELLCATQAALSEIAQAVGYASEFAFNRAFKRHHHVAPGGYRRRAQFAAAPVFRAAA